jgi:antirestriction protein
VYGNTIKRRRVKLMTKREAYFDDSPKIYVGTYRKYNEGSLKGKWFDLTDYVGVDDFYEDAIDFHSDERDPELMFQDWEHIPDDFIGESWISKEFWEYMKLTESMDEYDKEALDIYVNKLGISMKDDVYGAVEGFKRAYRGRFDDLEDYGRYLVDDLGGPINAVGRSSALYYIDYKQLGYDLNLDGEIPEGMNPEDYAKEYVDDFGEEGIIDLYFDYKLFGRDLRYDYFEENGHVFRII